jgi:EAL domain-containing protein (putative c-di-GMP-specific phosphodiesterase class I)
MVEYLINMAHKMQLQVVAEGVENEYQLDNMTDIGCDQVQGFFLCRPDVKPKLRFSH